MTHGWTLRKLEVWSSDSAKREWGFTLVEVMISLVILSVGSLGLAPLTLSIIKANSLSNQMTRATILAEDKMEELKRLSYTHVQYTQLRDTDSSTTDVTIDITANPSLFTNPDHSDAYPLGETGTVTLTSTPKRVWNVADNTPATGMKTVTVIVGWKTSTQPGAPAKPHYVVLTTIIHEYQ